VEYSRGTMNWSTLDEAYGFAKSHNYPFCFHVLVWGSQQPTWMKNLSKDDQLAEIKKWYQAVADRYPDIDYLQVVNEALHAPPDNSKSDSGNYIDALGGTGTTGHDWVIEAFRLARQYFPNTRLMINDYNVVGTTDQTNAYLAIIKDLQKENLVDLIGIQAHAFETKYYSAASIKTNLDSLAATGLDIMVTEMDIDGVSDNVQLTEYERVFPIFWKHPAVIGVCLWGYRVGLWRTSSGSYLTDNNGAERPAFLWLQDYVRNSEEWNGYPVTNGWANTGRWMGWVNIEKAPWCYVGKSWVWFASDTYSKESGCWGYIMNSQGKGTATGDNSWHGYPVTNGWANTGNWMGWVNIAYAPKLWTDYGWVYLMEDTVNDNGAWAWFYK
jgi:endo-1,4-beta-xylanase